jgi:hypothetical protein
MRKSLITVAVLLAIGTVVASIAKKTPRHSLPPQTFASSIAKAPQLRENAPPAPGLYLASPYSLLVLVPEAVGSTTVIAPKTNIQFDIRIVSRPVHLERIK